ncbi:MAG: TonB-dependent receptor, partial [Pseudomonadota bacterium]
MIKSNTNRTWRSQTGISLTCLTAFVTLLAHDTVLAQDPSSLEEIVVTARKKSENLQDVPLSITALSSLELQRAAVYDLGDLSEMTPGLTYQKVGSVATPTIRGLAQTSQTGLLGNVGVFLDGVFLNNRSSIDFGVLDLERIEVVKGPQGSLYGRNTFAGAINYVTRAPSTDAIEGRLTGEVGSEGRLEIGGSVNVPLGERAAVRLFASTSEFEGTIPNLRGGDELGGWNDRTAFGVSFLWEPTDNLRLKLTSLRNELEEDQPPLASVGFGNNDCGTRYALPDGQQLFSLFCGDLAGAAGDPNLDPLGFGQEGELTLTYLDLDYDFSFATLSLQVSDQDSDYFTFIDNVSDPTAVTRPFGPTGVSAQFFTNGGGDLGEQQSYELRLASNSDGPWTWLVGGSYFDTLTGGITNSFARVVDNPDEIRRITFVAERQETQSRALFGSVGYEINERNRVMAELRYTEDDVRLQAETIIDFIPGFPSSTTDQSVEFDYTTPRFTYEHNWSDDALLYVSAAQGVKSGGINRRVTDPRFLTFDPEENWTYEIGAKTTLWDGRATLNATLYYIDWSDLQNIAPASVVSGSAVVNADSATSQGIEIDSRIAVTENLEIRAALTVLDPEFGSGVIDASVGAICGQTAQIPPVDACSPDVSGNQLPRTSDLQAYLGATYTWPNLFQNFDGYFRLDTSHQAGKYNLSLNEVNQGDINLTNIRLGLVNDRYEFALWAENLFDEDFLARSTTVTDPEAGFLCTACGITRQLVYPG